MLKLHTNPENFYIAFIVCVCVRVCECMKQQRLRQRVNGKDSEAKGDANDSEGIVKTNNDNKNVS